MQAPLLSPHELANVVYAHGLLGRTPMHQRLLPLLLGCATQHAARLVGVGALLPSVPACLPC